MILKKNILLVFLFFFLFSFAVCKEKFNSIDYVGFYTRNFTHYAKAGRYDEKEFEYPNINNYRLILNYSNFPLVLLDDENNTICNTTNEHIEVSTNKNGKLKKISNFYYLPNEKTTFFIQGKFILGIFIGKIAVTTYSNNYKKASALLLDGNFFIDFLAPGVSKEYKNIPFNLKKNFASTITLKKYKYSISNNKININYLQVFELKSSSYSDSNYILERIINDYK